GRLGGDLRRQRRRSHAPVPGGAAPPQGRRFGRHRQYRLAVGAAAGRGHIAYNSSKAAVVSLTRSLARDFGAHGVRANSICPGEILTPPMLQQKLDDGGIAESELAASIPLGRPAEVAELTTFLLSDRASFISGAAVEIAGAQQVG